MEDSMSQNAISTQSIRTQTYKSWREVIRLQPDVARGELIRAQFAANLSAVAQYEDQSDGQDVDPKAKDIDKIYRRPDQFFSRTYLTVGMRHLLVSALRRVCGGDGAPVIQLKTTFGGGKTHSLLALYHLMKSGNKICDADSALHDVLVEAGVQTIPDVRIAVFEGTKHSAAAPTKVRSQTVNTVWGHIAAQLTAQARRPGLFDKLFAQADAQSVAPGSDAFRILFDEIGPCVVLIDELVAYARTLSDRQLPGGTFENFLTFIQQITEAAKLSTSGSLVVATLPESEREIGGAAGAKTLDVIGHTFGRLDAVWTPVAADEGFEIVRRRLFADYIDFDECKRICRAFADMYQNAQEGVYPPDATDRSDAYYKRLLRCYPIHPEIFDTLYQEWVTSFPHFQKTRGVLSFIAKIVHKLYMDKDASALILPGAIDLTNRDIRAELVHYINDSWNPIIDADIDGTSSHAYRIDATDPRAGDCAAARRLARCILFQSAPAASCGVQAEMRANERGIDKKHLHLAVAQPGDNISVFDDTLQKLVNELQYLYHDESHDESRYWFSTHPTLNKVAQDRIATVSDVDVLRTIEEQFRRNVSGSQDLPIQCFPKSYSDVADKQQIQCIVLDIRHTYCRARPNDNGATKFAHDIVVNKADNARRKHCNTLVFVAADENKVYAVNDKVRRYLAWESIDKDAERLDLSRSQRSELKQNIESHQKDAIEAMRSAFQWLLIPTCEDAAKTNDIAFEAKPIQINWLNATQPIRQALVDDEYLLEENWSGNLLQNLLDTYIWPVDPYISVKQLWDNLTDYVYMPRVKNVDVLKDAIKSGLASGCFAYASSAPSADNHFDAIFLDRPTVQVADMGYIIRRNFAVAQIESDQRKAAETPAPAAPNAPAVPPAAPYTATTAPRQPQTAPAAAPTTETDAYTHFDASIDIDTTRFTASIDHYYDEIIKHVINVPRSNVKLTLEVSLDTHESAPIDADVVRTLRTNCKALGIDHHIEH